ncbi:MAG: T9SS type A sorting domain-containing protein, partial [Bacteroidota bacterium]
RTVAMATVLFVDYFYFYLLSVSFDWADGVVSFAVGKWAKLVVACEDVKLFCIRIFHFKFHVEANGQEIKVKVIDEENSCYGYYYLELPDCNEDDDDCNIVNVIATAGDCTEDGLFFVDVKLEITSPNDSGFVIVVLDEVFGPFDYGSGFYGIGPFVANGQTYEFKIKDLFGDDCYTNILFTAPDCMEPTDCKIFNVSAEASECDDDGTFDVLIDFDYLEVGDDKFGIKGNDGDYGSYSYEDLPVLLEGIEGDGESLLEFVVYDLSHPNCNNFTILQAIPCAAEVWPGDANNDNMANKFDVLNIGIAYNNDGEKRDSASIEWAGMPVEDWPGAFKGGVNYKHADSNGDGVIDEADLEAIAINYGKTHGPVAPNNHPEGTDDDPPLFVDIESNPPVMGTPFELPIVLGDEERQVEGLYGLAFTINFDPEMVDASGIEIKLDESFMGTPGQDLITFEKKLIADGKMELALTRTDKENEKGFGPIGTVTGIIIDDILGKLAFEITDVKAIDAQENPVKLYTPQHEGELAPTNGDGDDAELEVFPNPTDRILNVRQEGVEEIQEVVLFNMVGKEMQRMRSPDRQFQLDVSDLLPGMYLLKVSYDNKQVSKKIIIH